MLRLTKLQWNGTSYFTTFPLEVAKEIAAQKGSAILWDYNEESKELTIQVVE